MIRCLQLENQPNWSGEGSLLEIVEREEDRLGGGNEAGFENRR